MFAFAWVSSRAELAGKYFQEIGIRNRQSPIEKEDKPDSRCTTKVTTVENEESILSELPKGHTKCYLELSI